MIVKWRGGFFGTSVSGRPGRMSRKPRARGGRSSSITALKSDRRAGFSPAAGRPLTPTFLSRRETGEGNYLDGPLPGGGGGGGPRGGGGVFFGGVGTRPPRVPGIGANPSAFFEG